MSWLKKVGNAIGWIVNPVGMGLEYMFGSNPSNTTRDPETGQMTTVNGWSKLKNWWSNTKDNISNWWSDKVVPAATNFYNDLTGKSQIEQQNEFQREMAEEEYQRNLQSIGDTAAAYEAAGFNRNILYGGSNGSPVGYSAPQLQAYSGSAKLDTILNRVGKVLQFVPAMYNATAALEGIDQAREKTKQAEIRTMADGINLLKSGFGLSDIAATRPYGFDFTGLQGGKRHIYRDLYKGQLFRPYEIGIDGSTSTSRRYLDAALKNQFDLLESIGISNTLRNTRNSYLGYQYGLDRRFGAAGRIIGMASQGLGTAAKFMTPQALKFWGLK